MRRGNRKPMSDTEINHLLLGLSLGASWMFDLFFVGVLRF